MDSSDLLTRGNIKRCPRCNKMDLSIINLFSVREFEEQGYLDLFCPNCMISVEKDRYGRTIRIIDFRNRHEASSPIRALLEAPKGQSFKAFLIKRSDLHG